MTEQEKKVYEVKVLRQPMTERNNMIGDETHLISAQWVEVTAQSIIFYNGSPIFKEVIAVFPSLNTVAYEKIKPQ